MYNVSSFGTDRFRSMYVCASSLSFAAGMAADPQLHVVVFLEGTEDRLCYMKAKTDAAQVFRTCKLKARCNEGTLQTLFGLDIAENEPGLSAGIYRFTPAESLGMSPGSNVVIGGLLRLFMVD